MDNQELIKRLATIHNALYQMNVAREQTLIVGDCIRELRGILEQLNKEDSKVATELTE